jgi:hypothetical protein
MTTLKELYENSKIKITVSTLTPEGIQTARQQLSDMNAPSSALFVTATDAKKYLDEETISDELRVWFDPITKISILEEGTLGSLLGMYVYSDLWFPPEKQFITNNFLVTEPFIDEKLAKKEVK